MHARETQPIRRGQMWRTGGLSDVKPQIPCASSILPQVTRPAGVGRTGGRDHRRRTCNRWSFLRWGEAPYWVARP